MNHIMNNTDRAINVFGSGPELVSQRRDQPPQSTNGSHLNVSIAGIFQEDTAN